MMLLMMMTRTTMMATVMLTMMMMVTTIMTTTTTVMLTKGLMTVMALRLGPLLPTHRPVVQWRSFPGLWHPDAPGEA